MNINVYSRREFFQHTSGIGLTALAGLMARESFAVAPTAKAKNVIFLYMSGGVSQVDSFDPKPKLNEMHGQDMPVPVERTQFNNNGKIFGSPFKFRRHGESGLDISELFPHIAKHADDMAVIRSMTTTFNEHATGNFMAHTGFPFLGHPSAGSWISYGLGSANQNLPTYILLRSGGAEHPLGGNGMFSSGFLPAQHQASIIKADATPPVPNIVPSEAQTLQRSRLDFLKQIDSAFASRTGHDPQVDAAIKNYETAFRMQAAVPAICDISGESQATRELYGLDDPNERMAHYGGQALLARKLIQQGVRFVELSCLREDIKHGGAQSPWDHHGALERGHRLLSAQVDKPIGALIHDLKTLGLFDETLLVFTGEFGRTPFTQGSDGRDHNPYGFSAWMAGGGIKGGTTYGATNELGYHVADKPATFYDLWATVLHQLGIDHEDLTYRYAGRDVRLTDVHGNVIREILT